MEKLNLDSSPEDKAGCGAVCVELAFRIDDLPFSDCSAATGVNYVCTGRVEWTVQPIAESSKVAASPPWTTPIGL